MAGTKTGLSLQVQCLIVLWWHQAMKKKDIILSLVVCCNRNNTFHSIRQWIVLYCRSPPLPQVGASSVVL